MLRLLFRTAVAILLFGAVAFGVDAFRQSFFRLLTVDTFAMGGTGYTGKVSQGEKDFWRLLSNPDMKAQASFEKLYWEGNPQAKCYALLGIRKLNRNRFKELLKTASQSTEKVHIQSGCTTHDEELGNVAKAIENGSYDLFVELRAGRDGR